MWILAKYRGKFAIYPFCSSSLHPKNYGKLNYKTINLIAPNMTVKKKITLVVGSLDKALENEQEVVLVMEEERMKGEEEKMIPREEMAKSPNGESVPAAVNWKAEDSNPNDRRESPSSSTKKANTAEAITNGNKAKSCKGCLYYSSRFKADSRNPLCVGFSRSLPNGSPNFPQFFPCVHYRDSCPFFVLYLLVFNA